MSIYTDYKYNLQLKYNLFKNLPNNMINRQDNRCAYCMIPNDRYRDSDLDEKLDSDFELKCQTIYITEYSGWKFCNKCFDRASRDIKIYLEEFIPLIELIENINNTSSPVHGNNPLIFYSNKFNKYIYGFINPQTNNIKKIKNNLYINIVSMYNEKKYKRDVPLTHLLEHNKQFRELLLDVVQKGRFNIPEQTKSKVLDLIYRYNKIL